MMKTFYPFFSLWLCTLGIALCAAPQPNIVVIMADDLGWRDLHCYGNEQVDTPFLDQLAAEGMRFTDAYAAAPVCSPTRAAMMTGLAPARLRLTNHAPGNPDGFALPGSDLQEPETVRHLALSYTTIAERLSAAGYATGHVGKWHLSYVNPRGSEQLDQRELYPEKQGFDVNIGGNSSGGPPSYFSPYRNPALKDGAAGEYLPSRLADEAMNFVRSNRGRPFFLNWWPYSVHYPMQAPAELIAKYRQRQEVKDPVYAAMIEGMDAAIGRFLKQLDEAGLRANTLILFKSDNGGYSGDNRPLRGFKGTLYEGGLRVPWIVRWPGRVPAGSICATPVISTDCYPTLLEAAGVQPVPGSTLDGRSLIPLFEQKPGFDRDAIFFHYPNYAFHKKNRLGSAMRARDFKLITYYDNGELELYRLSSDIGEEVNLSQQHPEIVRQLKDKLDAWLRQTDARLPVRKATK
jgi:arylsulfatase A-like enzyme